MTESLSSIATVAEHVLSQNKSHNREMNIVMTWDTPKINRNRE